MVERTGGNKKGNWKNLEVLELLSDEKGREQRSDEEKLKLRIVLCVWGTQVRNQATKL